MTKFDSVFDAILFDAGGIFVIPDPTVLAPLLAPLGGSLEISDHVRAHYRGMAAKSHAGSGERNWGDYNSAYVRSVGVHDYEVAHSAQLLDRTRSAYLWRWPIAESVQALAALFTAGVPIGVVSNASGQIEDTLRRAGVCQMGEGPLTPVRVIIDSEIVGVAKPDPAIFDFALVHFPTIDRSRIAYVGDSVTMDIAGARAAGLYPILLDPYDDHEHSDFARIRSLSELI